jgi:hypothetical protein
MNVFCTPAEITEFDIKVLVHENVFGFNVSVVDIVFMQVVKGQGDLDDHSAGIFFLEIVVFLNEAEKVALKSN